MTTMLILQNSVENKGLRAVARLLSSATEFVPGVLACVWSSFTVDTPCYNRRMERTKQVAALTRLVATMPILACLVGCGVICEDAPCSSDLLILNEIDIEGTEGCVDVIGDLKIGPSEDLIDLELPCLTSVNGSFQIQENRA